MNSYNLIIVCEGLGEDEVKTSDISGRTFCLQCEGASNKGQVLETRRLLRTGINVEEA